MIAHRLTTVKDVNKILVIKDAQIVEAGNHKELIEKNGLYKKMWDEYQQSIDWKISAEKTLKKDGYND
jgi:ATP-binding cassette subfamily B protein